jgi:hypothetical protein
MPDPLFKTFWTSHSLNSLHQKWCHILVEIWTFDYLFHKKLPVLVILMPVMIRSSESGSFLGGFRGFWGQWGCRSCWGEWGWRGFKAWKITTVEFSVFQILEFNDFRTNITLFWYFEKKILTESWNLLLNFGTFSVGGLWGCMRSKKFQIVDQA